MTQHLDFFHTPQSRSSGVLALLKELKADFTTHLVDQRAGQQRQPDYLAKNPMGKVPAIMHGDALVTEQVAIYIYLADVHAAAGLAPPIGDPLRGPYLRWIAFYGACFEPAIVDLSMKRAPAPQALCPYGDYQTMLETVVAQLGKGAYLLGDTFSAADVLWGTSLAWACAFELVPRLPVIDQYSERILRRPAIAAALASDAAAAAAAAAT
jgi:glutathione S-transferase